ncbi:MAG: hypothetical protein HYY01_08470 [Chloroflexi bacterium]|nr:hypothetical protein [Chloroflexota bacterium]
MGLPVGSRLDGGARTRASKSRTNRLRGLSRPQYRLGVGGVRAYYDVEGSEVHVLAIVHKSQAVEWLSREGE